MLKTVKGKVIAGTVAFGLLSGVGVAFGATDAGAQLKNWYDGQFGKSSDRIVAEVEEYSKGKIEGFVTEYNGLKTDASTKISARGQFVTDVTNEGVNTKAGEHIDAIKEEKLIIEGYLSDQFDGLRAAAEKLINETGQNALDFANDDLKKHAGAVGSEAQKKMVDEVDATTQNAIKDLEDTIKYAKEDLQAQLDKNTDLTIKDIKALIDAKINELRTKITKINNDLIKEQDRLLTLIAKSLLINAQADLDAIVDGINK